MPLRAVKTAGAEGMQRSLTGQPHAAELPLATSPRSEGPCFLQPKSQTLGLPVDFGTPNWCCCTRRRTPRERGSDLSLFVRVSRTYPSRQAKSLRMAHCVASYFRLLGNFAPFVSDATRDCLPRGRLPPSQPMGTVQIAVFSSDCLPATLVGTQWENVKKPAHADGSENKLNAL